MSRVTKHVLALIAVLAVHPCLAVERSESSLRAADAEQASIVEQPCK